MYGVIEVFMDAVFDMRWGFQKFLLNIVLGKATLPKTMFWGNNKNLERSSPLSLRSVAYFNANSR
jgi:hypothetical protein